MSLHKYFKPSASNTSHALNAVPVAATIAQLTTHEQIEVENAIRNLGGAPETRRSHTRSMTNASGVKLLNSHRTVVLKLQLESTIYPSQLSVVL